MTEGKLSRRIVADRIEWIQRMIGEIRLLPLESPEAFLADRRNVWAAESCLRRALEALLDLGRHILAKGFAVGSSEYKEIARQLGAHGVLPPSLAHLLQTLAGYRNRLVHFYHEVTHEELYQICTAHLQDVERVLESLLDWIRRHPHRMDHQL
ncbi:type VII toxin-antitoxin system HepT family RNase toxin [Desulfosoma sp.]